MSPASTGDATEQESATPSPPSRAVLHELPLPSRRWLVVAFCVAACVLAGSVLAGRYERNSSTFSPLDEAAHYDYVTHMLAGSIPRWGTLLDQDTLRMIDCLSPANSSPDKCSAYHRPPTGIAGSFSYEAQQPPLGYLPYLITATPNAPPNAALIHDRWGGMIWAAIAAALAVTYAALEALSLLQLFVLLVICLLSPVAVYSEFTVTNDSAGVTAGLVALLVVSICRRANVRKACSIGFLAGVVIGLMKGLFVFAPLALVIAAFIDAQPHHGWRAAIPDLARRHAAELALLIGSVGSFLGWTVFQDLRGTVASSVVLHALMGFAVTPRIQSSSMLTGILQQLSLFQLPTASLQPYAIWDIATYGAIFSMAIYRGVSTAWSNNRSLAIGVLVAAVAIGVGWTLLTYVQGHFNMVASARYSLPLLPLIALIIVRVNQKWPLLWIGCFIPLFALVVQLSTPGY